MAAAKMYSTTKRYPAKSYAQTLGSQLCPKLGLVKPRKSKKWPR
jgi:hypothetical protein